MVSLIDISEASTDPDLMVRFRAAAAEAGIPNASQWVFDHMLELVTSSVAENMPNEKIAGVYAYARNTRPPAPGIDPAAVIDAYIRYAVSKVNDPNA